MFSVNFSFIWVVNYKPAASRLFIYELRDRISCTVAFTAEYGFVSDSLPTL